MFYTVEWFPSDINDIRIEAPNNKFTVCLIIIYHIKSKAKHNDLWYIFNEKIRQ